MLLQEFIHLTGVNVTSLEYQAIETEYLNTDINKFDFCAKWKANYNNKMKKNGQNTAKIIVLKIYFLLWLVLFLP